MLRIEWIIIRSYKNVIKEMQEEMRNTVLFFKYLWHLLWDSAPDQPPTSKQHDFESSVIWIPPPPATPVNNVTKRKGHLRRKAFNEGSQLSASASSKWARLDPSFFWIPPQPATSVNSGNVKTILSIKIQTRALNFQLQPQPNCINDSTSKRLNRNFSTTLTRLLCNVVFLNPTNSAVRRHLKAIEPLSFRKSFSTTQSWLIRHVMESFSFCYFHHSTIRVRSQHADQPSSEDYETARQSLRCSISKSETFLRRSIWKDCQHWFQREDQVVVKAFTGTKSTTVRKKLLNISLKRSIYSWNSRISTSPHYFLQTSRL